MKRKPAVILAALMMKMCMVGAAAEESGEMGAAEVFETCVASTVHIETSSGGGTGFFVEESIIATNWHVINGTEVICQKRALRPMIRIRVE